MKIDYSLFEDYKREGKLISQDHPTLPLTIWNYSKNTQFERVWDEVTLMCRGLVTDFNGNVVARPFKKFFNLEEGEHIPTKTFTVLEKLDGSLGISFWYKGEWVFASRGSFTSDQAIKGKEMFNKLEKYSLFEDMTYMWEIIYPENRIVVDYGDKERLVLLGIIETKTGLEISLNGIRANGNYDVVKEYSNIANHIKLYELKLKHENDGIEGFVIKFTNGSRVKIKYSEYVRLHRLISMISTKSIWECLKNGDNMEQLLSEIPDEFYDKVREYRDELKSKWENLYQQIRSEYITINQSLGYVDDKTFANFIQDHPVKSCLFLMRNKKIDRIQEWIWDEIRPEFKML